MNLSESRGCQDTKKERETLNKLQIDTTSWYLSLCNPSLTTAMVYTVRVQEIGVELNYGSVDSSLPFSPPPDFNS